MNQTENSYSPPTSLEGLRDQLASIGAGESHIELGSRAYHTLAKLVDSPQQSAVHSISQLAHLHNVNASTLTRLAKRLGYNGFSEFQWVFRRHLTDDREYYSDRAGKLMEAEEISVEGLTLINQVAGDESNNISNLIKNIDPITLDQSAELLATSPSVRIHGLRQYYSVACFISYGLGMIRDHVAVLGDSGHGMAHSLAQLNSGDTLLVLGTSPYTKATIDTCRVAPIHGVRVITITDSYASPLASTADQVFIAPSSGSFFSNSTAACIILVEGLLALVARKLGNSAVDALKHQEHLIDELGVALHT